MKSEHSSSRVINLFSGSIMEPEFEFNEQRWNSYPGLTMEMYNLEEHPLISKNDENKIETCSNLAFTEGEMYFLGEDNKVDDEKCDIYSVNNSQASKGQEYSYEYSAFNEKDISELLSFINDPSTDLNMLLTDVLNAGPTDPNVKRKRTMKRTIKAKRTRKTKSQIDSLFQEYVCNSDWQNEDFDRISDKLGLHKKQVYKWYWDQKNKSEGLKAKNW